MEHEVHVPFPVGAVRAALAEPERGIRCVPGLTLDTVETPSIPGTTEGSDTATEGVELNEASDAVRVRGRLRLRVGNATITYRGSLRLTAEGPGFTVEAEGTEARGEGSAQLLLTVVPRPADSAEPEAPSVDVPLPAPAEGTVLAISATCGGSGRLAQATEEQLANAGRRLVDRFGAALGESLAAEPPDDDNAPVIPGIPAPEGAPEDSSSAKPAAATGEDSTAPDHTPPGAPGTSEADTSETSHAPEGAGAAEVPEPPEAVQDERSGLSVFETEIPPPSLDPGAQQQPAETDHTDHASDPEGGSKDVEAGSADDPEQDAAATDGTVSPGPTAEIPAPGPPPAEAAHARRTMIGRSAEEVDHAPPRGRYAPLPAPEPVSPSVTLRWAAPAAAVAIASAVVLSRVMRRRGR